ncbi:hypothetical protein [Paenibacillus chitinolyticus]
MNFKVGDKVTHKKHKHWGTGEIKRLSKSGLSAFVVWAEQFPFLNNCQLENLESVEG